MTWVCQHCGKENTRAAPIPGVYAHGRKRYLYNGCRCDICVRSYKARQRRYYENLIAATPNPDRKGYEWTGPELEFAERRDENGRYTYTAREVAKALGRTVFGVKSMRIKLGNPNTREAILAGSRKKAKAS